jgi:drug/metabolite transporter (DMT)-like permease
VAVLRGDELALPRQGDTQLAVLYLVAATVGLFLCVLYVVQRWTASATAYTFVSMPLVAVLAGAALLDEKITLAVVAGGAIVLAGVYVGAISWRSVPRREEALTGPP